MPTAYEKLTALLKELFQMDQADLDFGIYRIMNQKRDEIARFLDRDLLPQVQAAFAQYQSADRKSIQDAIDAAWHSAIDAGFNPEQSPKIIALRGQMSQYTVNTPALENEVYSHLYNFFRRYYQDGDFISIRRYKEGVYAIPYEGEEVKLHWANADQYYIKTSEAFRDYAFRLPDGWLVHFKVVEAETDRDNVKSEAEKDRRFMLAGDDFWSVDESALTIRFEYRADAQKRDQKTLNAAALQAILAHLPADWAAGLQTPAPTEAAPRRTLLEKHLSDYTARNTFDYFIHKDLRGFLRRELDFYIKNEVMHLDDIENQSAPKVEEYLSLVKALRSIAHKIIEFLAQIEDFQKKLWLKKKFVVETNYCITLDRVPEELYPEICANDAQREEWVRLFAIDEIKGDLVTPGYSVPLTVEFLRANPFLVLDTRFFAPAFVERLLASFDDLDAQLDGLLIHSENFQALNLLQEKYRRRVKCVYIDPPYNTDASPILYKNGYKDSSWLSLIFHRFITANKLLAEGSIITTAIDHAELFNLGKVLSIVFTDVNRIAIVTVQHNPKGRNQAVFFSENTEYLLVYTNDINKAEFNDVAIDDFVINSFDEKDEAGKFRWEPYIRARTAWSRSNRPDNWYPIYVSADLHTITSKFHEGYYEIYPTTNTGDFSWKNIQETFDSLNKNNYFKAVNENGKIVIYHQYRENQVLKNIWIDKKYQSEFNGTNLLKAIFGKSDLFSYPKSIYAVSDIIKISSPKDGIILDYFAGSGTTGHAVINLNREDGGHRKYILVEMGAYFNTVLKPRIQKVIYSADWRDGKPVSRQGSSHCFKYIRLESYEDTLNNLTLRRTRPQQLTLNSAPEFREDYLLSYMLEVESRGSLLNISSFVHPFNYQMNIATGIVGESTLTAVDLVETFNYLIGLHVQTIQSIRGFRVITGRTPSGERTLIIWRDLEQKSNAALEEFFRRQEYNPQDSEFDIIYVNGDNNLENLRRPDETWKVRLIEEDFLRLMFETDSD